MQNEDPEYRYFTFIVGIGVLALSCLLSEFLLMVMNVSFSYTSVIPIILVFFTVGVVAGFLLLYFGIIQVRAAHQATRLLIQLSIVIIIGAFLGLAGFMIEQFALSFY